MAETLEEVGVEAVVKGFGEFMAKMAAMNKAIQGTGAAGVVSKIGIVGLSLAFGALALAAAAVVAGVAVAAAAFLGLGVAALNIGRSVESAFAGVAKTTNGLTDEFGKMNKAGKEVLDQFRELAKEVPLSLEDLLKIGELAGQLGIAKDALVGFTEVVAGLAVATDLTIEEASLGLARLASIYQVTTDDMIENTERLGSTITFLGNNFATTEPQILNFAKRLAGIAVQFGVTQAEVLGFGAAITAAGVEAQLGSTAIQNAFIAIGKAVEEGGKELDAFAETAGVSADEFADAWKDDAAQAFIDFIEGLGDAGEDAFAILDEVGLSSDRTVRALIPLAAAGDLLADSINGANQAFEDNVALAREVGIRYATVDSKMQMFKNTIRDIALEIGLFLLPAFAELLEIVEPIIKAIGEGLVPAFKSIFEAITESLLPALGRLLDAFGFDITNSDLTQGIVNFGETIAGGIEAFADFVDEVAELVDLYQKGGIDSVAEHFGISQQDIDLIRDVGEVVLIAVGAFIALKVAILTVGAVAAVIGSIAVFMGNLGAALSLIASGEGILAVIGTLLAGLFTGLSILPVLLLAAVAALIGVIVVWGEDALRTFTQILLIIVVLFVNWFADMITLWSNMWASIQVNTTQAILNFLADFEEWKNKTLAKITEWTESAKQFIADMWLQIKKNTVQSILDALASFEEWKEDIIATIIELKDKAVEAVTTWWNAMIAVLNEKGAEIGAAIGGFVVDWVKKIKGNFEDWKKSGKAIMDGVLAGLKANIGKITAFITSLAKKILAKLKAALGIESPSTEFANIGKQLMEGLAVGISKNVSLPQVALDAAATRVMSAGGRIADRGMMSSNVDRSFNPTVNANYINTQSPSSIASDLALMAMLEAAS